MSTSPLAPIQKKFRLESPVENPPVVVEPRTVKKIRTFLAQKPPRAAQGGHKAIYAATLPSTSLAGRLAIGVTKGGKPCSDPALLALASYKEDQDAKGRTSFYDMPTEYQVGPDCVSVSKWMRGEGTPYAGGDGFDVLCDKPVSRNYPYPHPAQNFMREIFNLLQGPLQMYEDAQKTGLPNIVHGDLKAEQFVVDTKSKAGLPSNYSVLKLIDLPSTSNPTESTPGFCNPDKYGLAKRSHSDDIYAIKATLARVLFRVLTAPLCEGNQENPLNLNEDALQQALVLREDLSYMSKEKTAAYKKDGTPVLSTKTGLSLAYPDIFNPNRSQQVIKNLMVSITSSARNTQLTPVHQLAVDLLFYLEYIGQELDQILEMEAQRKPPAETQQQVINTLSNMIDDIQMHYFPRSGATGSPVKPDPAARVYPKDIQKVQTRLFGAD